MGASVNSNNNHGHGGAAQGHGGAAHGSVKEYVWGLIWSIVLTVIPFALVMSGTLSNPITLAIILLCAVAQIFVQLVFFLHMILFDKGSGRSMCIGETAIVNASGAAER